MDTKTNGEPSAEPVPQCISIFAKPTQQTFSTSLNA